MKKPVTIWSKYNKKTDKFEHNHIEDGHVENNIPTPKFPEQEGWKSATWKKEYGWLNGMKLIKSDFQPHLNCCYLDICPSIGYCNRPGNHDSPPSCFE